MVSFILYQVYGAEINGEILVVVMGLNCSLVEEHNGIEDKDITVSIWEGYKISP